MTTHAPSTADGWFRSFISGHIPLVKTFWLYGVVFGMAMQFMLDASPAKLKSPIAILMLGYMLVWSVATWKSAKNYSGPAVWRGLAYIAVLMPVIGVGLSVAVVVSSPAKKVQPVQAVPSMQFDPSTARPVDKSVFDPSTARIAE